MGILAPLYLAGLAALSLPLILHLVRRTPRGRQDFSSLMFLAPSPPAAHAPQPARPDPAAAPALAALALLAFAFARPFLARGGDAGRSADLPRRRVAILVDTSASMRRGDLWQQAMRQVEKELDELAPHDEVALFTFGERLQTVVDFDSDGRAAPAQPGRHRPPAAADSCARPGARPTWARRSSPWPASSTPPATCSSSPPSRRSCSSAIFRREPHRSAAGLRVARATCALSTRSVTPKRPRRMPSPTC